jgi:hypothetical protein
VTVSPSSGSGSPITISTSSNSLVASFSHPFGSGTVTQASATSTQVVKSFPNFGGSTTGNLVALIPHRGGGCIPGKPCGFNHPYSGSGCGDATISLAAATLALIAAAAAAAAEGGLNPLADAGFLIAWVAYNDAVNAWQNDCSEAYNDGGGGDGDAFDDFIVM